MARVGEETRTCCEKTMYNDPTSAEYRRGEGEIISKLKLCNIFNGISRCGVQISES